MVLFITSEIFFFFALFWIFSPVHTTHLVILLDLRQSELWELLFINTLFLAFSVIIRLLAYRNSVHGNIISYWYKIYYLNSKAILGIAIWACQLIKQVFRSVPLTHNATIIGNNVFTRYRYWVCCFSPHEENAWAWGSWHTQVFIFLLITILPRMWMFLENNMGNVVKEETLQKQIQNLKKYWISTLYYYLCIICISLVEGFLNPEPASFAYFLTFCVVHSSTIFLFTLYEFFWDTDAINKTRIVEIEPKYRKHIWGWLCCFFSIYTLYVFIAWNLLFFYLIQILISFIQPEIIANITVSVVLTDVKQRLVFIWLMYEKLLYTYNFLFWFWIPLYHWYNHKKYGG